LEHKQKFIEANSSYTHLVSYFTDKSF